VERSHSAYIAIVENGIALHRAASTKEFSRVVAARQLQQTRSCLRLSTDYIAQEEKAKKDSLEEQTRWRLVRDHRAELAAVPILVGLELA